MKMRYIGNASNKHFIKIIQIKFQREGHESLKIAACGVSKESWYMKQVHKSPRYVTGWNEILKIK